MPREGFEPVTLQLLRLLPLPLGYRGACHRGDSNSYCRPSEDRVSYQLDYDGVIIVSMQLAEYFAERFTIVKASPVAKAYISGLFADQAFKPVDLSRDSLVLSYGAARQSVDFKALQNIGDWVLWVDTCFPESLAQAIEVAESLGRISYYRCSRLLPSWRVYEELADTMPVIVPQLRWALRESNPRHLACDASALPLS